MVESYNMLMIAQYKNYHYAENVKSKEFSEKVKFVDLKIMEVMQQKTEQDYKKELVNTLLRSKDKTIAEFQERIEALEAKEQEMLDYFQAQKTEYAAAEADSAERVERQKIVESIAMAEVESEELSSDSDIQIVTNDLKSVSNYDDACNDYQNTEVERTNNLNNMQKIITRLLKKGNVVTGTQTDPSDFISHSGSRQNGELQANDSENNLNIEQY